MQEKLLIRKATIQDTEELVELRKILLSSGDTHYAAKSEEDNLAWQNAYRDWIKENISNEDVLIQVGQYDEDEKICSCVIGIIDSRAPMVGALNGRVGWGQSLVVSKDRRGLGIAEAMMDAFHNWFRENNVQKIVVQSSKMAEEFNRKRGYLQTGEQLLFKTIE
ncbi:GNAT family N-acetyltransferase [Bacillus thuringiensis]|uniref:N-acetyltransferase n=1 Tax=Bacillus thuringiensis TaxID=1428 RepID=A0A9W3VHN8_BACTU|nr:GNAT family N-acetyltransferase [Bacillus thuringiensis]AMR06032.1 GCN5 family acetyltransferase [Bacillus thuringiensis]AYF85446.1 N-acetyltransferase [Bacillus thuringiensis]EEM80134.1 acetyltransferase [Bacillus thuringiensis serovar huazhongensis BGSC 4BD1]PNK36485.1 N-acetyltransferase [Bacillus thuringiensis]